MWGVLVLNVLVARALLFGGLVAGILIMRVLLVGFFSRVANSLKEKPISC